MLNTEYVSAKGKKQERIFVINWSYVLPVILAFFISRASIIDKLTPFGLTFMAAYILSGRSNILCFCFFYTRNIFFSWIKWNRLYYCHADYLDYI